MCATSPKHGNAVKFVFPHINRKIIAFAKRPETSDVNKHVGKWSGLYAHIYACICTYVRFRLSDNSAKVKLTNLYRYSTTIDSALRQIQLLAGDMTYFFR